MAVQYRIGGEIYGTLNIFGALNVNGFPVSGIPTLNMRYVDNYTDFPAPVNGVITLDPNVAYFLTSRIDLQGNRIIASPNNCIFGASSELAFITSTGLSNTIPMISSGYSLTLRHVSLSQDNALYLDARDSTQALDWRGVNFVNCNTIGTIKNYNNFIFETGAFLNSSGLTLDGSMGTVGFSNSLFDSASGGTTFRILSTASFSRRFRIIFSSFVTLSGETSLAVNLSSSIPAESFILDNVNFSGGGTYLSGVNYLDNRASFFACNGIENTASLGQMYIFGNTTATAISSSTTYFKISGNTTTGNINQKFSHSMGRMTYTGGLIRSFKVTAIASMASGNNNIVYLASGKNGVADVTTAIPSTVGGAGRVDNVKTQGFFSLSAGEYVELFIRNSSAVQNVTVTDVNFLIEGLR